MTHSLHSFKLYSVLLIVQSFCLYLIEFKRMKPAKSKWEKYGYTLYVMN